MRTREYVEVSRGGQITGEGEGPSGGLKTEWLKTGARILKQLGKLLGEPKPGGFVRTNPAGIAISGDVILHLPWVYIDLSQGMQRDVFMWRYCNSTKDYTGGDNRWARWDELMDLPAFAAKVRKGRPYVPTA